MELSEKSRLDNSLSLIVKSSMIVFICLILSKIFTYLYRIIIARYFGPEIYGVFSLAFMVVGWFVAFFSFGLAEGVLRFISFYRGKKEIEKIKHVFKISLVISVFSSIISGILLFFLADFISINIFHNSSLIIFIKLFSFLVPLWTLSNIFLSTLRAYELIQWQSFILNILDNLVKVVLLILLIFLGFKTNSITFSFIFGFAIILIVSYLVCKYKLSQIFEKAKLPQSEKNKTTSELFSYSWPLMFMSFTYLLFSWIDSFTIGFFKGALEVGIYNAAVPIAFLLNFAPDIFMQLFFPLVTKEFSRKNLSLVKQISKQVGKWIFIINLPIFLILILFPGAIINLLFGENYIVAENALRLLSIGIFFSAMFRVSKFLISVIGKSKLMLFNIIITSIINIILNVILVPTYGINGAAFSTMISFILLSLILLFEAAHFTSIIPIRRKMLRILLAVIPPLLILIYLKQFILQTILNLILQGLFFFLIYFLLILLIKGFDKNDFMVLKKIKKKVDLKR